MTMSLVLVYMITLLFISDSQSFIEKSVLLTTLNPFEYGANITVLKDVIIDNIIDSDPIQWELTANDEIGFHLQLSLNASWSFHSTQITTLTLYIDSDSEIGSTARDLLVSFSQSNNIYFTVLIQIDRTDDNRIYPECDNNIPYTQQYGIGDIKSIVNTDNALTREQKATGNLNFSYIDYKTYPPTINYPLTLILENHPIENYLLFTYTNPGMTPKSCGYIKMQSNLPLNIYFAAEDITEDFNINSINITHKYLQTNSPTKSPTNNPTSYPTNNPIPSPTNNPTDDPSTDPTIDPTKDPTNDPTIDPTSDPTLDPTLDPTSDPTKYPSVDPTLDPTKNPSINPTKGPTFQPTLNPTAAPTNNSMVTPSESPITSYLPTISPTDSTNDPTAAPTNNPSINPTKGPTFQPTLNPTPALTNNSMVIPSESPITPYLPTISPTDSTNDPTAAPTDNPTPSPTNNPTTSPSILSTDNPTQSPLNIPTSKLTISPLLPSTTKPLYSSTSLRPTTSPTIFEPNTRSETESSSVLDTLLDKLIIILLLVVIICCMALIISFMRNRDKTHNNNANNNDGIDGPEGDPDFTLTKKTLTLAQQTGVKSNSVSIKKIKHKLDTIHKKKSFSDVLIDDDDINYDHVPNIQMSNIQSTESILNHQEIAENNNNYKDADISPTDGTGDELYDTQKNINDEHETPRFPNYKPWGKPFKKEKTDLTVYKMEGADIKNHNIDKINALPITPYSDDDQHITPTIINNDNYNTPNSSNNRYMNKERYDLEIIDLNDNAESDDEKKESFNYNPRRIAMESIKMNKLPTLPNTPIKDDNNNNNNNNNYNTPQYHSKLSDIHENYNDIARPTDFGSHV